MLEPIIHLLNQIVNLPVKDKLLFAMLFCILALLIVVIWQSIKYKLSVHQQARELFETWTQREIAQFKLDLNQRLTEEHDLKKQIWLKEKEADIRKDSLERSRDVLKGKVTEHFLPFFPDFPFNPMDARFFGSPIDLVVFDGLSEGDLRQIVFIEIKTGKSTKLKNNSWLSLLTEREKQVRKCIEEKRVKYELHHLDNYASKL
jgi:predicted Holliday junction resolvase-like endonuclease